MSETAVEAPRHATKSGARHGNPTAARKVSNAAGKTTSAAKTVRAATRKGPNIPAAVNPGASIPTARKTVILCFLAVVIVFTFGGLWGSGELPNPKKYLGATVAYTTLAVAAEFVPPLAMAMAVLFAFYILVHSLPQIQAISKQTATTSAGNVQPSAQSQAQTLPGLKGRTLTKAE